jgi:hypothetical protein
MANGPAIFVAPTAEGGFTSDYNLFDVGSNSSVAGATVGTIGVWEGLRYTDLATWYYELGLDQHSQVGNPDFVAPTGSDGVLGFGTPSGVPVFYSPAYGPNTTHLTAPYSVPIQQLNSIGAVVGGTLQLSGAWTQVNDTTNSSYTIPTPGTVVNVSGNTTTTTVTNVHYSFETNGFDGGAAFNYQAPLSAIPLLYYSTAAGSGATATWTFTGLIPGQTYQLNTINEATGGLGIAQYVVTDGKGTVLTASNVNQGNDNVASFINSGTAAEDVLVTTTVQTGTVSQTYTNHYTASYAFNPNYNENEVGQFIATGSTAVLTMIAEPGSALDADTALLIPVGVNQGAGNNFHLQTGSPAIDAGDPTTPFLQEPSPNGGRVNQGYDGDTVQAQVSPSAMSIQVLSPGNLAKYEIGEQLPINFQTTGLTSEQPVLLLHAGGASITTGLQGNWSADAFRTTGQSINDTQSAANIGTLANVPTALFSTAANLSSNTTGQGLDFQLPVANGTYTLNLYFADPQANAAGQRVFNIVANGVTLQANYDIFAAAKAQYGDGYHAVSLTFTVTVTGGHGLALDFVNASTAYGALVNAIALEQADAGGTASPTATVQVFTNAGTWQTLASGVPINAYGQGQYVWTVNQTSNGNTALIRVLSGSVTGTSQPFLLANGGTSFYINDGSLAGDQYTTAVGNDANSGKSPDQPLASLAALQRAYPIGAGDTIYVDAGTYNLSTNIVLPAADSGSALNPLVIIGPTIGSKAILDRGNTATSADVFQLTGISNVVIQNLTIEGAFDGVNLNATTGVTLLNDTIVNNVNDGIDVPYNVGVTNLVVKNSTINNNGSLVYGYGIYFGYNNSGILVVNTQIYNTFGTALYLNGSGNQTVQGGSYHNNNGDGILGSNSLIEDVTAYGNNNGNGADGININYGTITGNTVFGNRSAGINAGESVLASDNLVYDQTGDAIDLGYFATGIGNTTYGDGSGIFAGGGSTAEDNLSYDNSSSGIYYTASPPAAITANTVYGNAVGISGNEYYDGPTIPITGNLIYQNATAGIALISGTNQNIINNTIDELVGTDISLSSGYNGPGSTTTIENNILAVAAGPAITVGISSEAGFVSDYNLFDLTGNGSIANWEGVNYTTLSGWYYATGQDQLSQVGNPDFVSPAGADGVLGFKAQLGTQQVVTASSPTAFATTGVWTPYFNGNNTNPVDGGAGSLALLSAAGSGGTATWTFSGLTPGKLYQVAVNWPANFIAGTAVYT